MNIYGETVVSPEQSEVITSFVTPIRGGAQCTAVICWGDVEAEFHLYQNGIKIGGGRTTAGLPTLQLNYGSCPIGLAGNDVLLVTGEHNDSAPHSLKATLLVEML